jgi:hypothetical protein
MSKGKTNKPRPEGHVLVPAAAIGSLSILLVAGLAMLGMLERVNWLISRIVNSGKEGVFPKDLPSGLIWLGAIAFAFGVPFSILQVPGTWRRLMLWLTALVVVSGWAPVLGLAARSPDIAAPWIATLWAGICALVYAGNHRMACDEISNSPATNPPNETR